MWSSRGCVDSPGSASLWSPGGCISSERSAALFVWGGLGVALAVSGQQPCGVRGLH